MKTFRSFITEAAAQQGFVYEKNAAEVLKKFGIVPSNFTPAGAGSDIPDLMIQKNGVQKGCELKITAASAGSIVMKYAQESGKWSIGNPDEKNDEKIFVMELAKEVGILETIKKVWNQKPYKFTNDEKLKKEIEGLGKREIYSAEKDRFPEQNGEISATKIEDYYSMKKTYYINVGTHGFYLLGSTNPLKLKGIPRFGTAAKAKYRARVQAKGGGNYQFTFEMQFSIAKAMKSDYNIAPIIGKNNVKINMDKLELDWFLK
jgi:hypothetical protein